MMNRVISLSMFFPITAGKYMSAKPTRNVGAAAGASGICINSRIGTIGFVRIENKGVNSANAKTMVPIATTEGSRENHISKTLISEFFNNNFKFGAVLAFSIPCVNAQPKTPKIFYLFLGF